MFLSWSESDQDAALAFNRAKAEFCPGNCGTRQSEWDHNRFAYVGTSWRCPGCELLELERGNIPENAKGVHIGLKPNVDDEDGEAIREVAD